MEQRKSAHRRRLFSNTSDSYVLFTEKLSESTLTSALLFNYRLKFLLSFGAIKGVPLSPSTGFCLTRSGPTPGPRVSEAGVRSLSSKRELQVSSIQWVLVYRRISLLRFPPPVSIPVPLLSPSVFPASLLVSPLRLKIPAVPSL